MKKYSKKYVEQAVDYWKKRLAESEEIEDNGENLEEDTHGFLKVKRTTAEAKAKAKSAATTAGDPVAQLVAKHKQARAAVKKYLRNEINDIDGVEGDSKLEKFSVWNSCITKEGRWVPSSDGYMTITVTIYMPEKKGAIKRFLSNLNHFKGFAAFHTCGVSAMKKYVELFLGKPFAKQVSDKTVFDGVDDPDDNVNNKYVKYCCAFKLIDSADHLDESKDGAARFGF